MLFLANLGMYDIELTNMFPYEKSERRVGKMIREFIVNWFVESSSLSREQIEEDLEVNYIDKGIVDSFAFLELISACEENLEIEFTDDDFSNESIFRIAGIIRIIEAKGKK